LIVVVSLQPFKLRFEGFREFHHTKSNTLWLEPQTEVRKKLIIITCACAKVDTLAASWWVVGGWVDGPAPEGAA
jgi:hypothetical protein